MEKLTLDAATHTYKHGGLEISGVTKTLKDAGLIDLSHVPLEILQRAMMFGTHLHKATELHDRGQLDPASLDEALEPYMDAWCKFLDDTRAIIEPESIEKKVRSEKWNYAGKLDRILIIRGRRTVIDLKSGPIYPSVAIQLAAYLEAENEGLPVKQKVKDREVVRLKQDGTYELAKPDFFTPVDFKVFTSCLRINNWRKIHGQ